MTEDIQPQKTPPGSLDLMVGRRFPIQCNNPKDCPGSIPWELISPHEAQALRNHCGQSLQQLAERGGLSACEAVAVLEDCDYQKRWPKVLLTREDHDAHSKASGARLRELCEAKPPNVKAEP
jgi:hypothetical protein